MAVTPRLELRGASVAFRATVALDAVDLAVAPGELLAVLGPSGSGKSTLLRAVAGLQPLDRGAVLLDGAVVDGRPPHQRDVGLMFQDHALFPHLDVGANVAFGLRMQGLRHRDTTARVAELLDLVGLAGFGARPVATLSGGEQQRVALARALAPSPSLLLLDEPLGSLDRPLRERLVAELRTLFSALDLTVVAVTHDQSEAFALADQLAIMDGGRVVQTGPPAAVWAAPAHVTAARLLGFTNLAPVSLGGGRLATSWGDLGPAPVGAAETGPAPHVLVRPEAVHADPDGPVTGTVEQITFAGARTRLEVGVRGAPPLAVDVAGPPPAGLGAQVRLRVDPTGVVVLPG
ncbi:MAG: ABC transporter ATP-binding protein [Acidimicrobiales bacterium]